MSRADDKRTKSAKSSPTQPRSWEDINQRLGYLGEMERQIRALRDQFDQKVAVLKHQWLEASQPVVVEKEKLEEQMECFYWAHRDEVLAQGRKSVELAFGRLGSRRSRSLSVENAAAALQWLSHHGFDRYLRVRNEIDREALRSALLSGNGDGKEASAELLRCPGIRLRDEEEFWYEADATRQPAPAMAGIRAKASSVGESQRAEAMAAASEHS